MIGDKWNIGARVVHHGVCGEGTGTVKGTRDFKPEILVDFGNGFCIWCNAEDVNRQSRLERGDVVETAGLTGYLKSFDGSKGVVLSINRAHQSARVAFANRGQYWVALDRLTKIPLPARTPELLEELEKTPWISRDSISLQIPEGGKTMHHETFSYPNFTNMDVKDFKAPFHLVFCPNCKNVTLVVEEKLAKETAAALTEKTGNIHIVLKATEFCAPVANVNWTKL